MISDLADMAPDNAASPTFIVSCASWISNVSSVRRVVPCTGVPRRLYVSLVGVAVIGEADRTGGAPPVFGAS